MERTVIVIAAALCVVVMLWEAVQLSPSLLVFWGAFVAFVLLGVTAVERWERT